ncbi:tRNA-guanine transglycosylase DpdA [Aureimonas sp. D3]|uniref:tRNA-guanine transglycosylase DpdA n=1 Tax=Aureimonas sp. D3 TaxID=1638164 RepID=UPI0007854A6E|nr:tRNA-guanine transglycosylase DpdA [Aureimonas sp. D3]
MKFVFADSLDFVDPAYDFITDRNGARRAVHRDDQFPHEFLENAPYDGILVSRGIVGDALMTGKYTQAQLMRFRREGARKFLRYSEEKYPGSMMMGDCGAFTYRNMPEPPYRADDTAEFYEDGGFTHGCSPDHLIFDFDEHSRERQRSEVPESTQRRFDITLQNAAEFLRASTPLGRKFTPLGVIQGWSATSMASAASDLARMGYDYLAVGGTVPLKIEQLRRALAAIRDALPAHVRLHVLGFGKIENLQDLGRYGVASFDTTSPLVRAFKDARKNYWMRSPEGELSYYTAIRIPQAIENNRLKHKALEGRLHQEEIRRLEDAALDGVRRFASHEIIVDDALDAVMAYWEQLNWNDESSPTRRAESLERQRKSYARTLSDRPWEACNCRVCREGGVESLIFRNSNRNKRRGMHNLHVFHRHLRDFRAEAA